MLYFTFTLKRMNYYFKNLFKLFYLRFTAKSVCIDSDITHDYAEIYTPSREKLPWDKSNKPPTPPLHRFPSWESRIYQVANEGLSTAPTSQIDPTTTNVTTIHPTRVVTSQGYCDISVPVYATVKGVSASINCFMIIFIIKFYFFPCREPVKSGLVHSLVIPQTTPVMAKENTLIQQTRTVLPLGSQIVVVRTTLIRHCPVPVLVKVIRLHRRSRRLNIIHLDHHRRVSALNSILMLFNYP